MNKLFKIFTFVFALSLIFGMNLSAQDQSLHPPFVTNGERYMTTNNPTDDYTITGSWRNIANYPASKSGVCSYYWPDSNKILTVGGSSYTTACYFYDPVTNTYSSKAPLPIARAYGKMVRVKNKLYYIGSTQAWPTPDGKIYEYDPATNTWTQKATQPTPRVMGCAPCVWNDSLIITIGGTSNGWAASGQTNTVRAYNPSSNTWTTIGTFPLSASMMSAGCIGNKIVIAGGIIGTPAPTFSNIGYNGTITPGATMTITWVAKPNVYGQAVYRGSSGIWNGHVMFGPTQKSTAGALGEMYGRRPADDSTVTFLPNLVPGKGNIGNLSIIEKPDSIHIYIFAGYTTTTVNTANVYSFKKPTPPLTVPEVLYYTFDETGWDSTKNYAIPGRGAPWATLVGTGQTIAGTGQWGNALNGTGTSGNTDYVNTGWTTDIGTSSWTISLWLKNITTIFGYYFGDNTANSWRCFLNGAAGTNNIILKGGGMSNLIVKNVVPGPSVVTFVYDSAAGQTRGYVNGVLDTIRTQTALNINGSGPFKVGGYSSSDGLKGLMDEFRIYDKALTDAEVAAAWNHQFIISGITPVLNIIPEDYILSQNYPNPFNPTTTIEFKIPDNGLVVLKVYDVLGKEVKTLVNEVVNAGVYTVDFDASDLPSGAYFYRIEAGDYMDVKRMVLLK